MHEGRARFRSLTLGYLSGRLEIMIRWVRVTGLAIMLALFSILGVQPAQAADICVSPVVCVTVSVPGPTVRIPGPTVVLPPDPPVTLPRRTVTVPVPVTTTDIVRVPGPTVTETQRVPGPTRTVTETGQTSTTTATVTETETATVTATPPTVTQTVTRTRDGIITVEKAQAVGISIGLLLLGGLLALLALWATYTVGYKDSELQEEKMAEETLSQIRKS